MDVTHLLSARSGAPRFFSGNGAVSALFALRNEWSFSIKPWYLILKGLLVMWAVVKRCTQKSYSLVSSEVVLIFLKA